MRWVRVGDLGEALVWFTVQVSGGAPGALFTMESSSVSRSFFWDDVHGTGTEWLTFVYGPGIPKLRRSAR